MLGFLLRTGVRRGILGGSRAWTAVAGVLFGLRVLRKLTGREPEVVHTTRLRSGEALLVRHGEPSRASRQRRR